MSNYTTDTPPEKLCECGCGKTTPLAKRTRPDIGHIKGQPTRFVAGHNSPDRKRPSPFVRPLTERFWEKVDKGALDDCWMWKGSKDIRGYGVIRTNQKPYSAHCVCYELCHGSIPKGMFICHKCDNPGCVNPAHLWLGTPAENNRDRAVKERNNHVKGEDHPSTTLTESDIVTIRNLSENGVAQRAIARQYGIHQSSVWGIVHRKTWQHVP